MFVDDLKRSEKAEMAACKFYSSKGWFCRHSGQNKYYDFELINIDDNSKDLIEVKYDNASERTHNACFEVKNNHGEKSGLAGTKASTMFYMFPLEGCYEINVIKMKAWFKSKKNDGLWQRKMGGDKNAFELWLIPVDILITLDFVHEAIL